MKVPSCLMLCFTFACLASNDPSCKRDLSNHAIEAIRVTLPPDIAQKVTESLRRDREGLRLFENGNTLAIVHDFYRPIFRAIDFDAQVSTPIPDQVSDVTAAERTINKQQDEMSDDRIVRRVLTWAAVLVAPLGPGSCWLAGANPFSWDCMPLWVASAGGSGILWLLRGHYTQQVAVHANELSQGQTHLRWLEKSITEDTISGLALVLSRPPETRNGKVMDILAPVFAQKRISEVLVHNGFREIPLSE